MYNMMKNTDPVKSFWDEDTLSDDMLTPMEASRLLGYRSSTSHPVLNLIKRGKLKAVRLNARVIRVPKSEILKLINDHATV